MKHPECFCSTLVAGKGLLLPISLTCHANCTSVRSLSVVSDKKWWMGPLFLGQIFVSYFSLSFRNETSVRVQSCWVSDCPFWDSLILKSVPWADENSWGAAVKSRHSPGAQGVQGQSSLFIHLTIMWRSTCVHKICGVFWPLRGCGAKHRWPWDFFMDKLQLSAPEQHDSVHTLHFSAGLKTSRRCYNIFFFQCSTGLVSFQLLQAGITPIKSVELCRSAYLMTWSALSGEYRAAQNL